MSSVVNLIIKNVIYIKFRITMNIVPSAKIRKRGCVKKSYIMDSATCCSENGRYTEIIIDDSVICEFKETTKSIMIKTVPAKSIPKMVICKIKNFYILKFLYQEIILIASDICCCIIKYQGKKWIDYHMLVALLLSQS